MSERRHAENNLLDYVKQNDQTIDQEGFNNIDGLVMTQISNMHFEESGIDIHSGNAKTIYEIYEEMTDPASPSYDCFQSMSENDKDLLKALSDSPRFKEMEVSNFVENPVENQIDGFHSVGKDDGIEQFAAVTITYQQDGQDVHYMSFRPTEDMDGWTEDFLMLASNQTQAQSDSKDYMNIVGSQLSGELTGGGHSKGGNDFEYAYLFCNEDIRERISVGYIYDSPGLPADLIKGNPNYAKFQEVIDGHFICPEDSLIGLLLHENSNPIFVDSVETFVLQHDPYSWELDLENHRFILAEQTELSKYLNDALDVSVLSMTPEERQAVYGAIYLVLQNVEFIQGEDDGETVREEMNRITNILFKGWVDEDGNFNYKKFTEVVTVLLSQSEKADQLKDNLSSAVGKLIFCFAVVGCVYLTKNLIEEKVSEVLQAFERVQVIARQYLTAIWDEFEKFINNASITFISFAEGFMAWIDKKFNPGYRYAVANTYIEVNTDLLRDYANRLQKANVRVRELDRRLNSLYTKVGLLDLWNLMKADLLTGYSWRLSRCISYLNDTASEFDAVEHSIASQF